MKTTRYFDSLKLRPDRVAIKSKWIQSVIESPVEMVTQADGRIRLWGKIADAENRFLRVILLEDCETIHKAFFDRSYKP